MAPGHHEEDAHRPTAPERERRRGDDDERRAQRVGLAGLSGVRSTVRKAARQSAAIARATSPSSTYGSGAAGPGAGTTARSPSEDTARWSGVRQAPTRTRWAERHADRRTRTGTRAAHADHPGGVMAAASERCPLVPVCRSRRVGGECGPCCRRISRPVGRPASRGRRRRPRRDERCSARDRAAAAWRAPVRHRRRGAPGTAGDRRRRAGGGQRWADPRRYGGGTAAGIRPGVGILRPPCPSCWPGCGNSPSTYWPYWPCWCSSRRWSGGACRWPAIWWWRWRWPASPGW